MAAALAVTAAVAARDTGGASPVVAEPPGEQGPAGADEWFDRARASGGTVDIGQRGLKAQAQAATLRRGLRADAASWSALGPSNLGGRLTDVVVDPIRPDTVYAASASGGVWKSTDGGQSMAYAWSPELPQPVGALAIGSDGVLYAGTGESNPGGGSTSFGGAGVYRSTDAGATWQSIGLTDTERIGRIVVDPTNPNRVFVAASGRLFGAGGSRGLYASTNRGDTWKLALAGDNPATGVIDVAISAADPNTIFAAAWEHRRTPGTRPYGGPGSGLYRSTDGGATFTRLAGGLPAAGPRGGRIGVAVAPSDPQRVYTIWSDDAGELLGAWTSTDKGATWKAMGSGLSTGGFAWWFGRLWVDPAKPTRVFSAGVPMQESTDAGQTWRSSGGIHADQHGLAFDPRVAGRVFIGNDGGFYRSTTGGSVSGQWTRARNLANMQFYTVAVSAQDPSRIAGGLQDNGSVRSWAGWGSHLGGDGLANVIDPTNRDKLYACSQNGACSYSTNGGNSMQPFGQTTSSRRAWLTPVVLDPKNPSVVYYGGERLNRSTNSAAAFSAISPDLSRGPSGSSSYNTISTIGIAASDTKVIYVGTDDGRMWITRNTGQGWTEITAGLPQRWITRVAVDPTDAERAYVTLSGFTVDDHASHVFETTNGGRSWRNISTGLPNAPVNDVVVDPADRKRLYVATDVGVFTAASAGGEWTPAGAGLPNVPVFDLETTTSGGRTLVTAATFGLGIYRLAG
ncbi:WD40/YVTN/BNR-like repeat-containing protein [Pilimelia columellifera]|uniref:Exo-alpha-sialidase n=1 Tax=Pilimelia columellifera subsp. columellifera TaxID=706583 RepID=A0ABN3NP61_9ACTN